MAEGNLALSTIQEAVAKVVPNRPALVWRDVVVTHGELAIRSRRFASALLAWGASTGRRLANVPRWESGQAHVGILMRNRPEWLEAMFGSFKARAVPFNINFRYTSGELCDLLVQARPAALVFETHFASLVEAVLPLLSQTLLIEVSDSEQTAISRARNYEREVQSRGIENLPRNWSQDDRYMLFTGGTTGRPKGVLWRQVDLFVAALGGLNRNTSEAMRLSDVLANIRPETHSAVSPPPFMHGAAQWFSMPVLFRGGTVVIPNNNDAFDPDDVLSAVATYHARLLLIVGDSYGRPLANALKSIAYDLSSLNAIVTTGARLSPEVARGILEALPKIRIINSAGASESGAQLRSVVDAPRQSEATHTFQALPDTVVLDGQRSDVVQPGEDSIGWLARRGCVPLGYLGDEAKTLQTFPEIGGVRYSIPGDRARLRADGLIELLGRDNLVINSGGEKIFVEEVERVLMRHPQVADTLVVGRRSDHWGDEVVAIVQLIDAAKVDLYEIREFASKWLARYKLPKDIVVVDEVRRSVSGKGDYRWAKAIVESEL